MNPAVVNARGLPGYTFERAAGALWRSRFDAERNVIVADYMSWYNTARAHSSLDDATPDEHYFTYLPASAMAA